MTDNDKPNRDDLTTLAVRLREHAARIQQITLVELQHDLLAAAQAVEDLAGSEETIDKQAKAIASTLDQLDAYNRVEGNVETLEAAAETLRSVQ